MSKLRAFHDTGPSADSIDYTTLVVIHGWAWHSGVFRKLLPLACTHNARVILLNRRDFPGTEPYTEEELALLPPPPGEEQAGTFTEGPNVHAFMQARARELYDFLVDLVRRDGIPRAQRERNFGGIVVVGWSFGVTWMSALLAHVASFPVSPGEPSLREHILRVVFFDPAARIMGQPIDGVRDPYNPLFDRSVPAEDALPAFNRWVSGYYEHGSTLDTLERRVPLAQPPPTISIIAPDVLPEVVCMGPGARGASDGRLLAGALRTGLFGELRERALFLNHALSEAHPEGDDWRDVEVRFVWGMQSSWEVQYTRLLLLEQLAEAREQGRTVRNIRHVCVQGNHFVHWDDPERAIQAFLAPTEESGTRHKQ